MGIPAPIGVSAAGLPPQGDQANAVVTGKFTAVGPGLPFAFRGPMNLAIWAAFATALTTTAGSLTATTGASGAIAPGASVNSVNVPRGTVYGTFSGGSGALVLPTVTLWCDINAQTGAVSTPAEFNVNQLLGATVTVPSGVVNASIPASTTVLSVSRQNIAPTGAAPGGGSGSAGTRGAILLSSVPTSVPANNPRVPLQFALTTSAITVSGADANATFTGTAIVYTGTVQVERSFDGGLTWLVCNVGGSGQLAQYNAGTPVSITFGEPEKAVLYRLNCTTYSGISGISINYRISQTGGAAESLAIGPLSGG